MKKRILAVVLSICLLMSFGTIAFASGIMPLWNSTSECTTDLYCSGDSARCRLDVVGLSGSDSITATLTLQKENSRGNYTNVIQWKNLSGTGSLHFSETYSISASNTYRLKADVTVTGSNGTDSITVYGY